MKRTIFCVMLLAFVLVWAIAGAATLSMTPGVYQGTANGFHGPITVEIEVTENEILSVKTIEEEETFKVGDSAFATLEANAVANQSSADVVTGATITSAGFRSALEHALKAAGATD